MPILLAIEGTIHRAERAALNQGVTLTDSQVRSTLNRVRKHGIPGAPKSEAASARDKVLAQLHVDIASLRSALAVEEASGVTVDLSDAEWNLAVRTIEDSIRLRSNGAGSRDYLEFLQDFLPQNLRSSQSPA